MTLNEIISSFATLSLDAINIGYRPAGEDWARHVWANDHFYDFFGVTREEVQGHRIELVFDPDHLEEPVGQIRSAAERAPLRYIAMSQKLGTETKPQPKHWSNAKRSRRRSWSCRTDLCLR